MRELMNPRLPGLGLAPAMAAPAVNARERDALLRDALSREEAADRAARRQKGGLDTMRRPARAGAA